MNVGPRSGPDDSTLAVRFIWADVQEKLSIQILEPVLSKSVVFEPDRSFWGHLTSVVLLGGLATSTL